MLSSSPGISAPIKIGQLSFINAMPIQLPLNKGLLDNNFQVIKGSPNELNAAFLESKLDIGAMSSFFFLTQSNLTLVPNISISCFGPVGSVLLFSKQELPSLKSIAVPSCSATSVNLLKILFAEEYDFIPETIIIDQDRIVINQDKLVGTPSSSSLDNAVLVIGDQALHLASKWKDTYHITDLGNWWYKLTKLPMVFAVWAARNNWIEHNSHSFKEITEIFREAVSSGLGNMLPEILATAREQTRLSPERLSHYFLHELNFELTAKHLEGLNRFCFFCKKYKLM